MNKDKFVGELAKLCPSSTFLSLIGYRNDFAEVADYSLVFHMSYENALRRSVDIMESYLPKDAEEAKAKEELLSSFNASLKRSAEILVEEIDDAYTRFFDEDGKHIKGIKMHTASNALHLYGLVVYKRVLMPGMYPPDTRKPFTIVKDRLRSMCPVGKFRQFKIVPDRVDKISVDNLSLLAPTP